MFCNVHVSAKFDPILKKTSQVVFDSTILD